VAQEGAKDRRLFVGQPWQDLWEGVFAGPGQAGGPTDLVADRRRRCATRWARARRAGLGGGRGVSGSRGVSRRATWSAASVGSSLARLGGKASRYRATVRGWTGKSTRTSSGRKADTLGPVWSSRHTAPGRPLHRVPRVWPQASRAAGRCAKLRNARRAVLVTWRQPSCVASAPSRPTRAAQAAGTTRALCDLRACARVVGGTCRRAFGESMRESR
jgi:hypothetical protein